TTPQSRIPARRWAMLKIAFCLVFGILFVMGFSMATSEEAKPVSEPKLVHDVYFTLKDSTGPARARLVEACKKYLTKHPGTVYFSAGVLCPDLNREVNDRDWDVALHLVFIDKVAHDKYQEHPRHKQFIDENKENWKKVRVFDSYVT